MKPEQATKLREAFAPEVIGKLPRAKTKAAADANKKGDCPECGKYHVLPAVHLDYVGHAAVTDRLLAVDPEWTWEPMGRDQHGNPVLIQGAGLPNEPLGIWIKLTVCGVSRPGFGGGKNAKEAIGDAIRNAAMRFGVALDLWSKEDLHGESETTTTAAAPTASTNGAKHSDAQMRKLRATLGDLQKIAPDKDWTAEAKRITTSQFGVESTRELTREQMSSLIEEVLLWLDAENARQAEAIPFG